MKENKSILLSRDEKINIVLDAIAKERQLWISDFCADQWGLDTGSSAEYALIKDTLASENLIREIESTTSNCVITPKGNKVSETGGWLLYLKQQKEKEELNSINAELNITLAKSNLEANRINKRDSKFNRWGFVVNILFGFINIILLLWSVFK